jgi:hypothetical protein
MCYTAGTCSPRISGVAAMAGVNLDQSRTKASTTGSSAWSCVTEHRRLTGGEIEVTSNGARSHFGLPLKPLRAYQKRKALALLM